MINCKGCGKKWSWPNLRHYPGMCLEGLRKTSKPPSGDLVSGSRLEPWTTQIWSRSVYHSTTAFGTNHENKYYVQIPIFSNVFQISSTKWVRTSGEASGTKFPQHRIMRRDCVLVADPVTMKQQITILIWLCDTNSMHSTPQSCMKVSNHFYTPAVFSQWPVPIWLEIKRFLKLV
jgi:hypothetical protein